MGRVDDTTCAWCGRRIMTNPLVLFGGPRFVHLEDPYPLGGHDPEPISDHGAQPVRRR